MRTLRGQEDGCDPARLQQSIKRLGEFGVPVVEQIPFAEEKPVTGVRQLSRALLYEGRGGMRRPAICTRRVASSITQSTYEFIPIKLSVARA